MESNGSREVALPMSRRSAIRIGVASGLALASFPADLFGQTPRDSRDMDPHLGAAWEFAVKSSVKCLNGYWVVLYPDDKFAGDPLLLTKPELAMKPQSGTMPVGWGAKAGSIVVGPNAVLRLIHNANNQDANITLLPTEVMADMRVVRTMGGISTWQLFPANKLRPPY